MKVVLMGYMGSGKSAISRFLSSKLGWQSIDLDNFIEDKEGKTISNIFADKGVIYFRKKESQYLQEVLKSNDSMILALGGGTPCYSNNLEVLKIEPEVITVYLKASINLLVERLWKEKEHRPILSSIKDKNELLEFVGKHLFERVPFYSQADKTITTDGKSVGEIAEEITNLLF